MMKFMVLLLVLAFAGLFFISGPDGEPVLTLDDLKPELPNSEPEAPAAPAQVYKWQDENGVWQFSNQPRDEERGEMIEYDGNINTMPAVAAESSGSQSGSSASGQQLNMPTGLTTVSGEQAQQMMQTVTDLQQTVDDRKGEIDKLTGN